MADIKGIDGVVNYLKLIEAKNMAIYDVFKQNKLPLFKIEANNTDELTKKFTDFSSSLKHKNYDVIVLKDNEKLKFTFSNEIENKEQTILNDELSTKLNLILETLSKPDPKNTTSNNYAEYIEYKIKCEFYQKEIDKLEKDLAEAEQYISELEMQIQLLQEKLKNDDKFLKYYSMFKENNKEEKKPVLNENLSEDLKNEKKKILTEITTFLAKNFTNDELKKLNSMLQTKVDMLKSML